jgi:hypothetical protein
MSQTWKNCCDGNAAGGLTQQIVNAAESLETNAAKLNTFTNGSESESVNLGGVLTKSVRGMVKDFTDPMNGYLAQAADSASQAAASENAAANSEAEALSSKNAAANSAAAAEESRIAACECAESALSSKLSAAISESNAAAWAASVSHALSAAGSLANLWALVYPTLMNQGILEDYFYITDPDTEDEEYGMIADDDVAGEDWGPLILTV